MNRAARVEVQIRNIAFGGEGVGEVVQEFDVEESSLRGITAFVPYTAVGERVSARVEERKKNHLRCEPGEIISASPERQEPPCPYFGTCGGCHLQHLTTDAQNEAKRSILVNALRAARCSHTVIQAVAPMVCSDPFGYRRRLRLHVDPQGRVGFYRPRSRVVVAVDDCLIADAQLRSTLQKLEQLREVFAGVVGSVVLESDDDGVLAVLIAPMLQEGQAKELLRQCKDILPNCSVVAAEKELARVGRRLLNLLLPSNTTLSVAAGGFSQANWPINIALITRCLELLADDPSDLLYDLYSGAGNFSLPAARLGKRIVAVEQMPELVQWGQAAATERGFTNLQFHQSSVEAYLKRNRIIPGSSVLADPPRSGLGPLVKSLQSAQSLYFISCHLPSFVRDLKQLLELGWKCESIEAFDMFPQTTHMEILGVFRKSPSGNGGK